MTGANGVSVTQDSSTITLSPDSGQPASRATGLVFAPGARVDPRAYVPVLTRVAQRGHAVVIIKPPFGLALTASATPGSVIDRHPHVRCWAVGGHSLGGVAASGGYYVAMAADDVIAQPTTITGSIGVIIVNVNAAGLLDKLGLEDASVTSGAHKDLLSPLRPPKDDEQAIVAAVVDNMFQRFVSVVTTSRGSRLNRSHLDEITDGRIFSAERAHELGLVDRVAHRDDVIAEARARIGASDARVVRYYLGSKAPDTLSAAATTDTAGPSGLLSQLAESALADGTTPLYLWRGLAQ